MDLSIIIPVYNEEAIIAHTVRETLRFFSAQPISWELIIVNDGSTDATGRILETIALQQKNRSTVPSLLRRGWGSVRVITFPKNRGKGAAVREGFLQSRGDYMLFFDADLSTPLTEFPKFWRQKNERTVLIGSRVAPGADILRHQKLLKEAMGRFSNILIRTLTFLPFHDTQCGFKLYPAAFRPYLFTAQIDGAGFDIEWVMIARQEKFSMVEIPVTWINRPESRFGIISYLHTFIELNVIVINSIIKKLSSRFSIK